MTLLKSIISFEKTQSEDGVKIFTLTRSTNRLNLEWLENVLHLKPVTKDVIESKTGSQEEIAKLSKYELHNNRYAISLLQPLKGRNNFYYGKIPPHRYRELIVFIDKNESNLELFLPEDCVYYHELKKAFLAEQLDEEIRSLRKSIYKSNEGV